DARGSLRAADTGDILGGDRRSAAARADGAGVGLPAAADGYADGRSRRGRRCLRRAGRAERAAGGNPAPDQPRGVAETCGRVIDELQNRLWGRISPQAIVIFERPAVDDATQSRVYTEPVQNASRFARSGPPRVPGPFPMHPCVTNDAHDAGKRLTPFHVIDPPASKRLITTQRQATQPTRPRARSER